VGDLRKELKKIADPKKAKLLMRFFKTGKGEYGEGDVFLGLMVPQSRMLAKKYKDLDLKISVKSLIQSKFHEERLIALFILINKYQNTNHNKICFHFYIKNMKYINNWDLVDLSAPQIVGEHLLNLDKISAQQSRVSGDAHPSGSTHLLHNSSEPFGNMWLIFKMVTSSIAANAKKKVSQEAMKKLFRKEFRPLDTLELLAKSENIWERRIAVLATFRFIKEGRFDESLRLAEILLSDKQDLIHKAVGWMLREVGKRDQEAEINFLNKHYKKMPRTMLRYAIEKFPRELRQSYLLNRL
jgi:3-methyladenine DNA glycosylase AlkD